MYGVKVISKPQGFGSGAAGLGLAKAPSGMVSSPLRTMTGLSMLSAKVLLRFVMGFAASARVIW
ncbi:MAG: hypothetical protein EA423_08830 [Phycisphaerales bacterium]|nr:MAG: hypothetical protein EA423_08830 [Phycisphaerales bacterium]